MKSPFWSSDKKKSWKNPNGLVDLDGNPRAAGGGGPIEFNGGTGQRKQDLSPASTITSKYSTLAAAERSSGWNRGGDADALAEAQRRTIGQTRRNRYHDRKFLARPTANEEDNYGSIFGSKASVRGGSTLDTVSFHSLHRPLITQRPTAIMASSSGLGPLSQWQLTGENYIDSEQRKRHRAALAPRRNEDHFLGEALSKNNRRIICSDGMWETSHSGHTSPDSGGSSSPNSLTSSPMTDVEKPIRRPREERCTVFDRTVRIPRKKLVLDGPLYATSYAHWNSQVFPSSPASTQRVSD